MGTESAIAKTDDAPLEGPPSPKMTAVDKVVLGIAALSAGVLVTLAIMTAIGVEDRLVLADLFVKILFGTAGAAGIFAALRRANAQERGLELQAEQLSLAQANFRDDQVAAQRHAANEAYASAVERLSSESAMARVGAVFAIESIVQDWPRFKKQALEILETFLATRKLQEDERETLAAHRAAVGDTKRRGFRMPVGEDVQAVVLVLGRRDRGGETRRLSLRGHLSGVLFQACEFQRVAFQSVVAVCASFMRAEMAGALFVRTDLSGADIFDANLRLAKFTHTKLQRVTFYCSDLSDAEFVRCDLTDASFKNSVLDRAKFEGCIGLDPAALAEAKSSERMRIEPPLSGDP